MTWLHGLKLIFKTEKQNRAEVSDLLNLKKPEPVQTRAKPTREDWSILVIQFLLIFTFFLFGVAMLWLFRATSYSMDLIGFMPVTFFILSLASRK